MASHQEIITLIIAYTCVGVFVATSIITVLSLINVLKIDPAAKNRLFAILIVEVIVIGVGTFSGFMKFDTKSLSDKVESLALSEKNLESIAKSPDSNIKPRLFLHIAEESQRGQANDLIRKLSSDNFLTVPGIQKVDKSPTTNELRYFHTNEEGEVQKIAGSLAEKGIQVVIKYVHGYENSDKVKPKTYELWMAP